MVSFLMICAVCLENHHNNTLQFRPLIPRRSSLSRFPVVQHLPITSQTHTEQEHKQQPVQTKRHLDSENDHDEGIDSAIESRSLSINTSDDGGIEVSDTRS